MGSGVDEEGTLQLEVVSERLRFVGLAVTDESDLDAGFPPLLDRVTQLRDLLTAEHSTKVAEEDQDRRFVGPERSERDRLAGVDLEELDLGEACGNSHEVLL